MYDNKESINIYFKYIWCIIIFIYSYTGYVKKYVISEIVLFRNIISF